MMAVSTYHRTAHLVAVRIDPVAAPVLGQDVGVYVIEDGLLPAGATEDLHLVDGRLVQERLDERVRDCEHLRG